MSVYLRDGRAWTIFPAATLRQKWQIKQAMSSSHSTPTPGQPVLAPTMQCQMPTGQSPEDQFWRHWFKLSRLKSNGEVGMDCRSAALEVDARPPRLLSNRQARSSSTDRGQHRQWPYLIRPGHQTETQGNTGRDHIWQACTRLPDTGQHNRGHI